MKKKETKKDLYEAEVEAKGANYAAIGMLLLALVYFVYGIATNNGQDNAFYSIITLYNAIAFGYRGMKIEKNRKLSIFTSVIWGLLTIMLIIGYFKKF